MRSRQARKIVRMVKYTPIDRMSSTWSDRALQWCATYRQPQIKKALRYYWNGVADGKYPGGRVEHGHGYDAWHDEFGRLYPIRNPKRKRKARR